MAESSKWQKDESISTARQVLVFDGQDDIVEIPQDPFENNTTFTISLWIKPYLLNSGWQGFIGKQEYRRKPSMWIAPNNNGLHYDSYSLEYDRYSDVINNFFESTKQWIHVTWVKEGTEYRLYRNGELFALRKAPEAFKTKASSYLIGGVSSFFRGEISEVSIWSVARTLEEIREDMQRTLKGNELGLSYYWQLNEGSGEIARDRVNRTNNGAITGATWKEVNIPLADESDGGEVEETSTPTTGEKETPQTSDGEGTQTGDETGTSDEGGNQPELVQPPNDGNVYFKNPTPQLAYPPQPVLSFDGTDDFVNLGQQPNLKIGNEITLETWVYIEPLQEWPNSGIVSNFDENNSDQSGYGLLMDDNNGIDFILNLSSNNQIRYTYINSRSIEESKWHHVAGTYNGEVMKIYVDGVETASKAVSSTGINYNPESDLRLGIYEFDDENYYFQGKIAEVRVWNIARTPEDIQKDMHRRLFGYEKGLVAYWRLNEGSGDAVEDKTVSNNSGTINGATWQEVEVPIESLSVLTFDGSGDYVELPIESIPTGNEITVSFWAYGGDSLPKNNSVIIAVPTNGVYFVNVHLPWGDGKVYFDCGSDGKSYNRIYKSASPEDYKGKWTHWAFSLNAATGQMLIYLNGEVWCEGSNKHLPIPKPDKVTLGNSYDGSLRELAIWNKALSNEEIKAKMYGNLTGEESGLVAYYPLDEGSGDTVYDKTENGHNGTIHDATWQQEEKKTT